MDSQEELNKVRKAKRDFLIVAALGLLLAAIIGFLIVVKVVDTLAVIPLESEQEA